MIPAQYKLLSFPRGRWGAIGWNVEEAVLISTAGWSRKLFAIQDLHRLAHLRGAKLNHFAGIAEVVERRTRRTGEGRPGSEYAIVRRKPVATGPGPSRRSTPLGGSAAGLGQTPA